MVHSVKPTGLVQNRLFLTRGIFCLNCFVKTQSPEILELFYLTFHKPSKKQNIMCPTSKKPKHTLRSRLYRRWKAFLNVLGGFQAVALILDQSSLTSLALQLLFRDLILLKLLCAVGICSID